MVSPCPEERERINNTRKIIELGLSGQLFSLSALEPTKYLDLDTYNKLFTIKPWKPELNITQPYSVSSLISFSIPDKVLVLCVDFSNRPATTPLSTIDNRMVISSNSLVNYYKEVTYNKLNLNVEVHGWYRMPQPSTYYTNGSWGRNGTYPHNSYGLIRDAVNVAFSDPLISWSSFDVDGDNILDYIMIVAAGTDATMDSSFVDNFWSVAWGFGNIPIGTTVKSYNQATVTSEYYYSNQNIGIECHEFGHLLGFPDEYDYSGSTYGVGNWSLMGYGNWLNYANTPCHPSPRCKVKSGIVYPVINVTGNIALPSSTLNENILKYTSDDTNEYWLVEYRERTNYDAYLPNSGLMIWKCDDRAIGPCYFIQIQEADGRFDLVNRMNYGDSTDVYPTGINNSFSSLSNPRPTYCNGTNYDNIAITSITRLSSYINFNASVIVSCTEPTATLQLS